MDNKTYKLVPNEDLRNSINNSKLLIKNEMNNYSNLAKTLKDAAKKKADADRKYEKKQNDKNSAARAEATEVYGAAYEACSESLSKLIGYISVLEDDWAHLIWQIESTTPKSAPKEVNDFEKYKKGVYSDKQKIDDGLTDAGIELTVKTPEDDPNAPVAADLIDTDADDVSIADLISDDADDNASDTAAEDAADDTVDTDTAVDVDADAEVKTEDKPYADNAEQVTSGASVERAAKNIAPVSIDISSHVEKVVAIAMDKLSGALEKRIENYFATYVPSIPEGFGGVSAGAGIGAETAALQEKIAEDEKALLEKLVGIVELLKKLNTDMATITATYASLDAKNKEVIELQRQSNDMQRHTLREQQGVQVNQRVINTDQLKIAEDQVALTGIQKKAADEQARISAAQSALSDSQRAIVDTQASLEDAMKDVIAEQKRIITAQQAIVAENAKQVESHKTIVAYQTEVAEAQKDILANQKQLVKDQKTTGERQKETADLQKGIVEDVKEILKEQKNTKVKKPQTKAE